MYSHLLTLLCLLLPQVVLSQRVEISSSLEGNEGSSLEIVCWATDATGQFSSPAPITLREGNVMFNPDGRVSSSTNATHKTYTLMNLMRSDSGTRVNCGIAETRSMDVAIQVFYAPSVTRVTEEDVVVSTTMTMPASINFTIDGSPFPSGTVTRLDSNQVPDGIRFVGSAVEIRTVDRNDGGMYRLTVSNRVDAAMVDFLIVVEYPPVFSDRVSEDIMCTGDMSPYTCVMMTGSTGLLDCTFQSSPAGNITYNLPFHSNTNMTEEGIIRIVSADSLFDNGNYSCTANNTVLGQSRVVTREFQLSVGDVPSAVENSTAVVNNGMVVITWTYSGDRSLSLTFNVSIESLDSQADPITRMVSGDQNQLMIPLSNLLSDNDYLVTIMAINLLGSSSGMDATFITPSTGSVPTSTPGSIGTFTPTTADSRRAVSTLASVVLLLLCALALV